MSQAKPFEISKRLDDKSRMSREAHVRICEGVRVKFPRATRPIWMKIYLEGRGQPPWVKEKLRLRDIDAPEIKTPEGRAAKKFVEDAVRGKRIVITTTKPDKWDRYLSDVFLTVRNAKILTVGTRATGHEYSINGIEEIYLNNLLLEKGHASIKTDWSLDDWEM